MTTLDDARAVREALEILLDYGDSPQVHLRIEARSKAMEALAAARRIEALAGAEPVMQLKRWSKVGGWMEVSETGEYVRFDDVLVRLSTDAQSAPKRNWQLCIERHCHDEKKCGWPDECEIAMIPEQSVRVPESAWLIESVSVGTVNYWYGRKSGRIVFWEPDANDALRFARKEDAEKAILMWDIQLAKATGHVWLSAAEEPKS